MAFAFAEALRGELLPGPVCFGLYLFGGYSVPEESYGPGGSVDPEVELEQYVSADDGVPGDVVGFEGRPLYGRWDCYAQPGNLDFRLEQRELASACHSCYLVCSDFREIEFPCHQYVY